MALRRYARDPILGFGRRFGTAQAIRAIRSGLRNGTISSTEDILHEGDRLDTVAGRKYGDGTLWWVIAAASDIGWAAQAPPGTVLTIPNLEHVARVVG